MTVSRFRHTQATPSRAERNFLNINPTGAIWDCSNMLACNDRFVAMPWAQLGSTVVLRHTDYGKIASTPPLLSGQQGPIIDLAFNPFDANKLFTASEDGTIMGWDIPEEGLTQNLTDSIVHLQGHTKKVGIMNFHPSASNVLASAGADMVVNVWDVNCNKAKEVLKCHNEQIMSLDWNLDGSLLSSTSKDKKLNIMDPREGNVVLSTNAHQGGKTQRCVWAKRLDRIMTVGFSNTQIRQVMVWDARSMAKPLQTETIDQSSSVMLPFFDEDTSILYIGTRGEGNIRFYEHMDGRLVSSSAYTSSEAHKGLCMFPKWSLDTRQCEIGRFYALTSRMLYNIQMILPRRQADVELQTDVYPPTFSNIPAMTADAYFNGENQKPLERDLKDLFDSSSSKLKADPSVVSRREKVVGAAPTIMKHIKVPSAKSPLLTKTSTNPQRKGSTSSTYADPMEVDFDPSTGEKGNGKIPVEALKQLHVLVLCLRQQQEEVKQCRENLQEKEQSVMETISKIDSIISAPSL